MMEAAYQIREMTKTPGWQAFTEYLLVTGTPLRNKLLNDLGVDSLEEYKKTAGLLAGIQIALDAPDKVEKLANAARAAERDERDAE